MSTSETKTSMPEVLQALLFPVIIDYMSEVTDEISNIAAKATVKNIPYKSEVNAALRSHRKVLRDKIYDVFLSRKVLNKYPLMRHVKSLEGSCFQKCIIIMAGLDIEVSEMCDILQADEDSITSQRSKRRKDIERIFGRKPWMK
ncbi:MAG: hypothetical protein IJN52_06520 [Bacteroidales bacterium]|nr:hypothetical protein [Bacteroidales bacterium]